MRPSPPREAPPVTLPRLFVASDGRMPLDIPAGQHVGVFLRDLDLATLVAIAGPGGWLAPVLGAADHAGASSDGQRAALPSVALDLDAVEGLNADEAAVRFVVRTLGVPIVTTRRSLVAADVARLGGVGLTHVFAFDSTGLGRALEGHPGNGTGSIVSPGPVLAHMAPADIERLPRPLVAYGLLATPALARTALRIADAVVVGVDCAVAMAVEGSQTGEGRWVRLPLDIEAAGH